MQPVYEGISETIKTNADNNDLRKALESLVKKGAKQMEQMSRKFRGSNETETCRNIFNYIKNNFTYLADGNEQTIKLPSALLKTKVGDCKSFSLFTASILTNLGISYKFVYTSYNNNPVPGHVYIETGNGCKIDAVYGIFNSEKPPKFKYKKTMNVNTMSGLGAMCGTCYPKRRMSYTDQGLMGKNIALTIPLAPGRGIFLGMVKKNLDGMATKLTKVNQEKLKKTWHNAGGSFEKLQAAIKEGASKPAKKLGLLGKLRGILKKKGLTGLGQADPKKAENEIKAAIIAVSSAIGTAVATPGAGTAAGAALGAALSVMVPILMDLVLQTGDAEITETIVTNPTEIVPDDSTDSDSSKGGINPLILVAVGGAALYFLTKK